MKALVDLYCGPAGQGDEEGVTQLEHALQCAALARRSGAATSEILAALLHDVGHLCAGPEVPRMEGLGVARHEEVGARFLAGLGLPSEITELVRGHVDAKRYLVAMRHDYGGRLSPVSRETLALQGGPMGEAECRAFESAPLFGAKLRLRAWDEAAKVPGRRTPPFEDYAAALAAACSG